MTKEGRILKALSGFYYVQCEDELVTCRARGNFRNDKITPLVGDNVIIQMSYNNTGYGIEILERKNELLRPKVANIDYSVIIVSVKDPDFSSKLLNKIICLNENSNVEIIIIFTKLDLLLSEEFENIQRIMNYYKEIGYNVFSNNDEDIDEFKNLVSQKYVSISGQSGAGKSTFIRLLYREIKIDKGNLAVAGFNLGKIKKRDIPMLRRRVGVVFQDYKLLPKKTVYENIAYAMEVIGERRRNIKKRVMEVLDLVGLKHKVRSFPNELSGGEQQRIAIARAIVNNPQVLIADEPTGNLDPDNSWEIMNLLERINLQGTTVLMATHNSQIVNTLRHRVIAIENGRVVRDEAEGEYGYDD